MTKASMRVGALYATFWVTGVGIVLLGVAIPHMAGAARDGANARHFLCEFLGTLVGSSMVRRGSQATLLRGLALCVAGAMAVAEFRVMVDAKLFVFGVGLGLVISATNLLAGREAEMEQRASRLEILNFYWALGAMMCPWLVGWMLRGFAATVGFRFVAGMFAAALVAVWRTGGAGAAATASPERMEAKPAKGLVVCCMLAFLLVGVETSISNWTPSLAGRMSVNSGGLWMAGSVFWMGILAGRLAASRVLHRVGLRKFGIVAAAAGGAGVAAMIEAQGVGMLCVAAFAAAFCIGPIFPVVISRALALPKKGLIFVAGGLGSSSLPWVMGVVSERLGSLQRAYATVAVACLLVAVLFGAMWRGDEELAAR